MVFCYLRRCLLASLRFRFRTRRKLQKSTYVSGVAEFSYASSSYMYMYYRVLRTQTTSSHVIYRTLQISRYKNKIQHSNVAQTDGCSQFKCSGQISIELGDSLGLSHRVRVQVRVCSIDDGQNLTYISSRYVSLTFIT